MILLIILIYTALITPYRMAFGDLNHQTGLYLSDLTVDFLFCVDILLSCITAYYDKEGDLVTSRSKIFLNYVKSLMLLDVISSFPYNLFINLNEDRASRKNYNVLIRILKLLRLYKLIQASKIMSMLKNYTKSKVLDQIQDYLSIKHSAIRILNTFLTIIVSAHVSGCI